jgi:hypothetical protein
MSVQAVGLRVAAGFPLLFADVARSLSAAGAPQRDEDKTPTATAVVSAPSQWSFSTDTCWYVRAFIDAIPTDSPLGGRHHWMLGKAIRLACAYRLGCVTEADHKAAIDALSARFTEVLATVGQPRKPRPREFAGLIKDGTNTAAAKTDDEARAELGGHDHLNDEWVTLVTGNGSTSQQAPGPQAPSPQPTAPQPGTPPSQAATGKKKGPSVASQLVAMARKEYTASATTAHPTEHCRAAHTSHYRCAAESLDYVKSWPAATSKPVALPRHHRHSPTRSTCSRVTPPGRLHAPCTYG